jgi:protocatechuate 3,4-dioxygenase beta subunit
MNNNRRQVLKWVGLSGIGGLITWKANAQEIINNECLSTDDILGPFYIPNAPFIDQLAPDGAAGTPIVITGTVYANDCETIIPQAVVDVWHANDDGDYEDTHYRGKVNTQVNGTYSFQSILPGKYLNGASFRPRHFHYKVSFDNVELTTQIYFQGDTSIPGDPWASSPDAEDRIIPIMEDENGVLHGVADIYLDVDPLIINSTQQVEQKTSQIVKIFPNPLQTSGQIALFLAQSGNVNLQVYDLRGKKVMADMVNEVLQQGEHLIEIQSNSRLGVKLPAGIYILQMRVDYQIMDAMRFIIS